MSIVNCLGANWRIITREELGKPGATLLDVTAGNRHIHRDKFSPLIVYLDRQEGLRIEPDVLADYRRLPFADGYWDEGCIVYDPNYYSRTGTPAPKWYRVHHEDPLERDGTWWGPPYLTKHAMVNEISSAQREFARVSSRMCFKWTDSQHDVRKILTLFTCWSTQLPPWERESGSFKARTTGRTHWVKLVRKNGVRSLMGQTRLER